MSWDVAVFASRSDEASPRADWMPLDLGTMEAVQERISKALPGTVWTDDETGFWQNEGLSFEMSLTPRPDSLQVNLVFVRVCGNANPFSGLRQLAAATGWYLMDCSDSSWIDIENPSTASWDRFRSLRDSL
ncbi:hypothetical protein [Gimesia panareensis]|uniref:hypothetical protein n=1 Tax=Gimesia panareensis TaxID=2527978 RepID=UPI00119E1E92|nr:hypothetical protein [Gimesia panareensis]